MLVWAGAGVVPTAVPGLSSTIEAQAAEKKKVVKKKVIKKRVIKKVGKKKGKVKRLDSKKWAKAKPGAFRSKEIQSKNFKPFKKWTASLKRSIEEAKKRKGPCTATKLNRCLHTHWMKFLDTIRDADKLTQLRKVNKYMNQRRYITDPKNWGKKDFWSTPHEFLSKRGDCEDYSIAKYWSLKELGWDEMSLRIFAVKDMNLKVGHAVLGVYHGGKVYILDNQIKVVAKDTSIRHYKPVFSINAKAWWRHRAS